MPDRLAIVLVLSLCLIWQVAFASQGFMLAGTNDAEHASMHLFGHSHHHHADGGFHENETPEGARHVQADGLMNLTAVFSASPAFAARAPWSLAFLQPVEGVPPSPYLAGPERPPRPIV